MLVILRENVKNLGRIGDIIKVKDGYARNFLLPRKLVVAAEESNVAVIEHHKRLLEKKRQAQRQVAEEVAKKMADFTCTISRKVGEHDKLFGSVGVNDISESLRAGGFDVEKKAIHLSAPIKSLGVHNVSIKLDNDVQATLKVSVVKED